MSTSQSLSKSGYQGISDLNVVFKEFVKMRSRLRSDPLNIDMKLFHQLENLINYVDPLAKLREATYVLIDNLKEVKQESEEEA